MDDPGLSWSQLKAFEACSRLASFNAAAAALGLTASAVRYQIGLLEDRLDGRLFERGGGRLVPTAAGAEFAKQIVRPMRELTAACAAFTQKGVEAPLTLTAPPLFARQFLFDGAFLKWCAANRVKLDIADAKRNLLARAPIAGVRLGAESDPELALVEVLKVNLVVAAAPAIAEAARPADPSWWDEQVLLNTGLSDLAWPAAWAALNAKPTTPPRTHDFSSYAAALKAATFGRGVILAPLPFAGAELSAGRLARISDILLPSKLVYSLVMRKDLASTGRGRALRRVLLSAVQRALAEMRVDEAKDAAISDA